jgi:crossover junction endodeoxyribonuclease RuvC
MARAEPPVVILGVDPGTRATGWGVLAIENGGHRVLACDVIVPKARLPIEQRLQHIFSELGDVIANHLPTVMAIEAPFVGANVRSAMAVGEARTVATLAATLAGVQVCHYAPASIKQSVAGYGLGDKAQVREMLRLQLGVDTLPENLNATDALAVALCHATAQRAATLLAQAGGG